MNSLSEFLSSPLLDFIPSNSPSNNIEQPDQIDMLLETLSEIDIQLLDRRVTDNLDDDEHQQDLVSRGQTLVLYVCCCSYSLWLYLLALFCCCNLYICCFCT